jgi:hypothetical protein
MLHELAFNLNEMRKQLERLDEERSEYAAPVSLGLHNKLIDAKYIMARIKNNDYRN